MKNVRILLLLVVLITVIFFSRNATWILKESKEISKVNGAIKMGMSILLNSMEGGDGGQNITYVAHKNLTLHTEENKSSGAGLLEDPPGEDYDVMIARKESLQMKFLQSLIQQQKESELKGGKGEKYLILYPIFSGLGNNMAVLSEAILTCFLTNRRFYLYKWESFNQYFQLPFENYMMQDESFLSSDYIGSEKECNASPEELLHSDKKYIVLRTTCKLVDYITFNEEFWPMLHKNGFILHPHLKSGADIRKTVYSFLYNKVITLKEDISGEVQKIKDSFHWNDYYIIGIQIRTGKIGIRDAPTFFLDTPDIDLFTRFALQQTEKARNKTSKPVKWFVACDNKLVKAKIRSAYGRYFLSNSCILSHSNRDLERKARSSGLLCSLYDSYLLSSVDEAIITAKSTFGILSINRNPRMKRIQIMKGDWKNYKSQSQLHLL